MGEYIDRDAFIAEQRHLYCENCARRKGMKNGKVKFLYEIGEAPCRSCGIGDVLDDLEDLPVTPHGDLIDRNALPTGRVEWEDIVNAPAVISSNLQS